MDFEALLQSFLSPDNATRRAAEAAINNLRSHKDALALELVKVSDAFGNRQNAYPSATFNRENADTDKTRVI